MRVIKHSCGVNVYGHMQNLVEALRAAGLSEREAKQSLEIVYHWLNERYPVSAALAKATVLKEAGVDVPEQHGAAPPGKEA